MRRPSLKTISDQLCALSKALAKLTSKRWATKTDVKNTETKIMATQAEIAADLRQQRTLIVKISQESTSNLEKLRELEEAINNGGNASPEVVEALADLKSGLTDLDNLTPDLPEGEPTPNPEA